MKRSTFVQSSAALALAAGPRPAAAATAIKAGSVTIDPMGLAYYAKDQGFFDKAGLDVTITTVGGAGMMAGVVGGALDLGITDPLTIAGSYIHGVNFKMFAPSAIATPETRTDQLAVLNESPIKTGADLNGKTIGVVVLKTFQQAAVLGWVEKNGGDPKTIKLIEVPFPQMVAAVTAGRVDAVALTEPFLSGARDKIRGLGNLFSGIAPRLMFLAYFSSDTWLRANAATAAKFAAVIRDTATWANSHQADSAKILTTVSGLPAAVASVMPRSAYGTAVTPALVQPIIDAGARYGVIERRVNAADIIWNGA